MLDFPGCGCDQIKSQTLLAEFHMEACCHLGGVYLLPLETDISAILESLYTMICSSLYRLFFMLRPPVQFTRELQLQLVEFSGGRSRSIQRFNLFVAKLVLAHHNTDLIDSSMTAPFRRAVQKISFALNCS